MPDQQVQAPAAPADDPLTPPLEGPPGGGIFSLEGRRAPGLYLMGWILSVSGLVVTFIIGPQATDESIRLVLIGIGVIIATVGLAAAAGAQVLERQDRDPDRYRGPAPLLVFGIYYFAVSLLGIALFAAGLDGPASPVAFLVIGAAQALGYIVVVWLFLVRTGALTWREMGWPTWRVDGWDAPAHRGEPVGVLRSIGIAIAVMLPVTFGVLILGAVVGTLLDVQAPDVVPDMANSLEALVVALAAALLIPIGEEVFFRGFAITAWMRDLGPRSALIRSSVFFAFIHIVNIQAADAREGLGQAILTVAVIFPVGFVLGWLFLRTGLVGAIAGHAAYNATLLFLMFAGTNLV